MGIVGLLARAQQRRQRHLAPVPAQHLDDRRSFHIFTRYIVVYGTQVLGFSRSLILNFVMIQAIASMFTNPIFGHLSDRIGRRQITAMSCAAMMVWAFIYFAYFALLDTRSVPLVLLAIFLSLWRPSRPAARFNRGALSVRDVSDLNGRRGVSGVHLRDQPDCRAAAARSERGTWSPMRRARRLAQEDVMSDARQVTAVARQRPFTASRLTRCLFSVRGLPELGYCAWEPTAKARFWFRDDARQVCATRLRVLRHRNLVVSLVECA